MYDMPSHAPSLGLARLVYGQLRSTRCSWAIPISRLFTAIGTKNMILFPLSKALGNKVSKRQMPWLH